MSVILCDYSFWSKLWKMSIGLDTGIHRKEQKLLSELMNSRKSLTAERSPAMTYGGKRWCHDQYRYSNDMSDTQTERVDSLFQSRHAESCNMAETPRRLESPIFV